MPVGESFSYALLRAVPSLARGELLNVGVVLHCRRRQFLVARTHVDEARLTMLDPAADIRAIRGHLALIEKVAAGVECPNPIASMDRSDRFGWIVAPASTVVQPSPVHTGISDDPSSTLGHLFGELVIAPTPHDPHHPPTGS